MKIQFTAITLAIALALPLSAQAGK